MKKKSLFLALIAILSVAAYSQNALFDQQMQIGFEEKQGQYADLDAKIVNENGDTVLLRDVITKPTILNLVYYRCPGTCSPLMWGISKFIDEMDLKLGQDYQVLTISFDHTESIDLGKKKKASYINNMKDKESAAAWQFFVADSSQIAAITKSVGFHFQKVNNEYVHPTGLIALAADGKITRYLRGIDFLPFDIKITMVEAANGKIGPSINRLLAVCYSYDTTGNQFVFNVTRVSAILISFFLAIFLVILALKKPRLKRA
ncbi:MAG TPA: SCO family protein [Bacteroidales bacterium]|nr:SCO family protein [Bacteroidales bacterium]